MNRTPLQTQAEQIGALCLCANLRKASRLVTKLYDDYLQPSGLLTTQFILAAAIGGHESIALTPLADQLGMDPTTLARNLKPLERDGLIQIVAGADRRTRMLTLTTHGADVLTRALPLWAQAQAQVVTELGEERSRIMLGDWAEMAALAQR